MSLYGIHESLYLIHLITLDKREIEVIQKEIKSDYSVNLSGKIKQYP